MKRDNKAPYRGTLYLGMEGVILPRHDDPDNEHRFQDLEKRWLNRHEFYYPEVVDALGRVAVKVFSTSALGVSFMIDGGYREIRDTLGVVGSIETNIYEPRFVYNKLDAINTHWTTKGLAHWPKKQENTRPEGAKAVWVDDHIMSNDYGYEVIKEHPLMSDPNFQVINPVSDLGLTLENVEQIKNFIDS